MWKLCSQALRVGGFINLTLFMPIAPHSIASSSTRASKRTHHKASSIRSESVDSEIEKGVTDSARSMKTCPTHEPVTQTKSVPEADVICSSLPDP